MRYRVTLPREGNPRSTGVVLAFVQWDGVRSQKGRKPQPGERAQCQHQCCAPGLGCENQLAVPAENEAGVQRPAHYRGRQGGPNGRDHGTGVDHCDHRDKRDDRHTRGTGGNGRHRCSDAKRHPEREAEPPWEERTCAHDGKSTGSGGRRQRRLRIPNGMTGFLDAALSRRSCVQTVGSPTSGPGTSPSQPVNLRLHHIAECLVESRDVTVTIGSPRRNPGARRDQPPARGSDPRSDKKTVGTVLDEADLPITAIADQLGNTPAVAERHYRKQRVAKVVNAAAAAP